MATYVGRERSRAPWGWALVLTIVAGLMALWGIVVASSGLDAQQTCAIRHGVSNAAYEMRVFPLQGWCVGEHAEVAMLPTWYGPLVVALASLAVVLWVLGWLVRYADRGRIAFREVRIVLVSLLVLTTVATGLAAAGERPSARVRMEAEAYAARAKRAAERAALGVAPDARGPAPTATAPSTSPAGVKIAGVPAATIRAELVRLRGAATKEAGPSMLWPTALHVVSTPCGEGVHGVVLRLVGEFTTRDFHTAADTADFDRIMKDNEAAAASLVAAWLGVASLEGAPVDVMKGEYYFDVPRQPDLSAHVGFDQGVGQIEVTSACATS